MHFTNKIKWKIQNLNNKMSIIRKTSNSIKLGLLKDFNALRTLFKSPNERINERRVKSS